MPSNEIASLCDWVESCYRGPSWHGPAFRPTARKAPLEVVAWRPAPNRHNIAEQVAHAAYWKYVARRLITGEKRGSFSLKGSNWIPFEAAVSKQVWADLLDLIDTEHAAFLAAVGDLTPKSAERPAGKRDLTIAQLVRGVGAHDVYHAGQIGLLRRLAPGGK